MLGLSAVVAAVPATAQDDARALFREGVSAFRADRFEEARDAFQRAFELSNRPSILVNLGSAQRQLGELLEARASYRQFLEISDDRRLKRRVQAELEDVEALIPVLTIRVQNLAPGDRVTVDGQTLTSIEEPFETNPGLREVQVLRGERILSSVSVRCEPEGREEVSLTVPAFVEPEQVAQQTVEPDDNNGAIVGSTDDDDDGPNVGLIVGLSAAAVAAVVAVVVVILVAGGGDDPFQGNLIPGSVRVP